MEGGVMAAREPNVVDKRIRDLEAVFELIPGPAFLFTGDGAIAHANAAGARALGRLGPSGLIAAMVRSIESPERASGFHVMRLRGLSGSPYYLAVGRNKKKSREKGDTPDLDGTAPLPTVDERRVLALVLGGLTNTEVTARLRRTKVGRRRRGRARQGG